MENRSSNNTAQKIIKNTALRRVIVFFIIVFLLLENIISLRGDYLSIKQVSKNYTEIFFTNLKIKYAVLGINFIIIFGLFLIINKLIRKGLKVFFKDDKKEMPKLPNKSIAFIIAIITSIIAKSILTEKFMLLTNIAWFGFNDPIFNNDISYYTFVLPFIKSLLTYLIGISIFSIIYTAFYYIITFNVYLDGVDRNLLKKNMFIKQIIFNSFLTVLLCSIYIWVFSQNILTQTLLTIGDSPKTELIGASSTDAKIKFWGYRIFSIVIIFSALRLIKYIKRQNFKQGAISILIVPIYLVGLFIVMVYSSEIYMGSNELDKEKKYIGYNIEYTQNAYGIDIEQVDITDYNTITYDQVTKNEKLISNIPLVTSEVVEQTLEQQQEDSMYYSYKNSKLALYEVNGEENLYYVTPREMITSNKSYNNQTYEYTHGYSMMLTPASKTDKNGYVEYAKSQRGVQKELNLGIEEPRIYFGLETNSEIVVDSDYGAEYDYLSSAVKKGENSYTGSAGLKLGFWDRLILGLNNGNLKLAFSKYINEDSKVISERNIIDRLNTLLPNLVYDEPYLVLSENGKLVWVIDGYTVSDEYPYSQFVTLDNGMEINYIRNSVKVLVDAYNGTTNYYITDRTDPLIMSYSYLYPCLFANSNNTIPEDISKHFTYPKMLYKVQSEMINLYHGASEDILYRGDNVWQITTETANKNSKINPYYTLVKTVDSVESKLGLVITYNKSGKQSMTAYLVGTCEDGKNNLKLYKFGSNTSVAGISQVNYQIEQDDNIASELENLNITGTKLKKEMIIVPIENSLLYVEPVYQVRLNEKEDVLPVLKKVIVASGNFLAIGDSLEEAIKNLYSDYSVELDFYDAEDIDALIDSIIKSNKNLRESLEAKDYEMIGKDLNSLENLIDQLEVLHKSQEKDTAEKEENEILVTQE